MTEFWSVPPAHGRLIDHKITTSSVDITGLGHLGTHIAEAIEALGVKMFTLRDGDVVEGRNLSGSSYGWDHVGLTKVDAMEEILRSRGFIKDNGEGHKMAIRKFPTMMTAKSSMDPPSEFYVLATDSAESRFAITGAIYRSIVQDMGSKEPLWPFSSWLIDARSRCFIQSETSNAVGEVYLVPLLSRRARIRYARNLKTLMKDVTPEASCDMANIIQLPLIIAGVVASIITNITNGDINEDVGTVKWYIDANKMSVAKLQY